MSISTVGPEASADSHLEETRPSEPIAFPSNAAPTIGVELELSLVDPKTGDLVSRAAEVLTAAKDDPHFTPELFESIVEINTGVCTTVGDVRRDLQERLGTMRAIADTLGLDFMCTGTHPTADWRQVPISGADRYQNLVNSMRWPARRLLICGVHVHVGMQSGEHAVALLNSLPVFMPHLLALSGSSPFWAGDDTGMASSRSKIFEALPTAGMPPRVQNWSEFATLMRTLLSAGSIKSIREIWWDVRPHTGFGTIEVRICDGVNTLSEVCALTAFTQCLCAYLQERYNHGEPMPSLRDWTLRENKWRAARDGLDAMMIRNERGDTVRLAEHIAQTVQELMPTAKKLGCSKELSGIEKIFEHGPSYARQRRLRKSTDWPEFVKGMTNELRSDEPC